MNEEEIIEQVRIPGRRISVALKGIVSALVQTEEPITVDQIHRRLRDQNVSIHESTIFRQLKSLTKISIVNEVLFGDGKVRYQLGMSPYHKHYVVCEKCGAHKPFKAEMAPRGLNQFLAGTTGFKIKRHAITYFGLCPKCRTGGGRSQIPVSVG